MSADYLCVYHSLFDPSHELHPCSTGEPACSTFAWLDLVSMAQYEDGDDLKRGQLRHSVRALAERWNWSRMRTNRWLRRRHEAKRLVVGTQTGRKLPIITICNYDSYKPAAATGGTQVGRKKKTAGKKGSTTWLTPYWDVWLEVYGKESEPPAGILAKNLAPLDKKHGVAVVLPRWRRYLKATDPQYVSVPKFAQTFGSWKPSHQSDLPDLRGIES